MSDVYTDDFVLEDEDDLGIEEPGIDAPGIKAPEISLAQVDPIDVDELEVDEGGVDELDVDVLDVKAPEISLAQADTAAEAPESYRDLALRLYANTRGMPWFSEYMKKQGVESGESASVESIAEAIKSEAVTPEEIINGVSRAYNSDRNAQEMYYQAHASAPKHAERYLEGRTQQDIAKREMIFNIAQDAGIPESYIQDLLKQPGVNTNRIISQLTGWRDVEGIGEGVALLGEFGLRSWGEDVGPAIAGAKVAGQVYKWTKPIQLGLAWHPVLGKAAKVASGAVAGTAGVTTYLLGTTFLTKPVSDMIFGPREQLTPGRTIRSRWPCSWPVFRYRLSGAEDVCSYPGNDWRKNRYGQFGHDERNVAPTPGAGWPRRLPRLLASGEKFCKGPGRCRKVQLFQRAV